MADVIPISRGPKTAAWAALGMKLFLGSWGINFVGLFVAFFWLRARLPSWPPPHLPALPRTLPTINTGIALLSSLACWRTVESVRGGRRRAAKIAVVATLALGTLFLVLQLVSWSHVWQLGLKPYHRADSAPWRTATVYAGCFYTLTWFHAAHVLCGLAILGWMTPGVLKGRYSAREHQPVLFASWFWHFVTVAWLLVFLSLYVV